MKKLLCLLLLALGVAALYGQSVSSSGAFTYRYDLDIPEGPNGFGPDLSLVYNSQAGNGIMGLGWSIDGLGQITREGDGIIAHLSNSFLFNGTKIFPDGINRFYTQAENNLVIRAHGLGEENSYWTVTDRNGTIYYYGMAPGSIANGPGDGFITSIDGSIYPDARIWALSKVEDIHGNYWTVDYYEKNGNYYPEKIVYSQGNGASLFWKILFTYENRLDNGEIHDNGTFSRTYRLKAITIKSGANSFEDNNGNLISKVVLNYKAQQSHYVPSRISDISKYGNNGNDPTILNTSCIQNNYIATGQILDTISFDWSGNNNNGIESSFKALDTDLRQYKKQFLDVNGDGRDDLILSDFKNNGGATGIKIGISTQSGFDFYPGNEITGDLTNYEKYYIDSNNNNSIDILLSDYDGSQGNSGVYISEGMTGRWDWGLNQDLRGYQKDFADITGNGRPDLILSDYLNNNGTIGMKVLGSVSSGLGYYYNSNPWFSNPNVWEWSSDKRQFQKFFEDNNDDGKSDLILCDFATNDGSTGIYIYRSNGTGFSSTPVWSHSQDTRYYKKAFAQVAGDDTEDLILFDFDSGTGVTGIKFGEAISNGFNTWSWSTTSDYRHYNKELIDVNGDNKADLIFVDSSMSNSSGEIFLALSNGDKSDPWSWNGEDGDSWRWFGRIANPDKYEYHFADITGDGELEIIHTDYFGNDGSTGIYIDTLNDSSRIVSMSSNPNSWEVDISYELIPVQKTSTEGDFLRTVSSITHSDRVNPPTTTNYEHMEGRYSSDIIPTFLGFRVLKKVKPDGTTLITQMHHDEVKAGFPQKTELISKNGTSAISTYYFYKEQAGEVEGSSKVYQSAELVLKDNNLDGINDKAFFEIYGYTTDGHLEFSVDYGEIDVTTAEMWSNNPAYAQTTSHSHPSIDQSYSWDIGFDKIHLYYEYTDISNANIIKRFKTIVYEYGINQEWSLSSEESVYYDGGQLGAPVYIGNINRITTENDLKDTSIEYGYYPNGMLSWVRKYNAATGGSVLSSQYFYDDNYGYYQVLKKNGLDHTSVNTYDSYMRPVSYTDPNGVIWETVYDQFGRVHKTISLGDTLESPTNEFIYQESQDNNGIFIPRSVIEKSKNNQGNYRTTVTYYDGLNRPIQTKAEATTEAGDIQYRTHDFYYNSSGLLIAESVPYWSQDQSFEQDRTQLNTTYEYDSLNRRTKIISPNNSYSETVYLENGFLEIGPNRDSCTLTQKIGNQIEQKTYDSLVYSGIPFSSVKTISAWNGTIIIDNDGNEIRTQKDHLGRKISYSDPTMGTWLYEYDRNGNLTKQSDSKGNVISFTYDVLNRPLTRTSFDENITWNYDTGLNGIGRLSSTTFNNGNNQYSYDSKGRIVEQSKTLSEHTRSISYQYGHNNQPISITYPNNRVVSYSYDDTGEILSIMEGNNYYISNLRYKSYGKIASYNLGNSTSTEFTYNDSSFSESTRDFRLSSILINSGNEVIGNSAYSYDLSGNILSKDFSDTFNGVYTESFDYDNFSRLVSYSSSLNAFQFGSIYAYDSQNNLISKDGMSYFYNPNKSNQLEEIRVGSDIQNQYSGYDANGNLTEEIGKSTFIIEALGTGVVNNPPKMELWVGDRRERVWTITNTTRSTFDHSTFWNGTDKISVVFPNDNGDGGIDTNLYVYNLTVNGYSIDSTSPIVEFDRGSNWRDGIDILSGRHGMAWTGALRFSVPVSCNASRTYTYNSNNQLESVFCNGKTSSFTYDHNGQRISKTAEGKTTYYFFPVYEETYSGSILEESVQYIFANSMRIASIHRQGSSTDDEVRYYHSDHLGSAVRVTDANGNIIHSMAYDPWGKTIFSSGTKSPRYQFTDQEWDAEIGLNYYDARYYDPALGRFLQADTYLDGLNRYAYCRNNPVRYTDPTGHLAGPNLHTPIDPEGGGAGGGGAPPQDNNDPEPDDQEPDDQEPDDPEPDDPEPEKPEPEKPDNKPTGPTGNDSDDDQNGTNEDFLDEIVDALEIEMEEAIATAAIIGIYKYLELMAKINELEDRAEALTELYNELKDALEPSLDIDSADDVHTLGEMMEPNNFDPTEDTTSIVVVPEPLPEDLKPKVKPTKAAKIIKTIGTIIEVFDNLRG